MRLDFRTVTAVLFTLIVTCSWALQNEPASHSTLEAHSTDDDKEWIDLSVAVRMQRDERSASPLEKRSLENPPSTPVLLERNAWPRSFSEALTLTKRNVPGTLKSSLTRHIASARRAMSVVITWYGGQDLLNPACFSDSDHWAPTDNSMVAAVTIEWPGKPPCGSFVKIQHRSDASKHITVRIVDSCGGCVPGKPHIDLTIGAFQKLYPKDVGLVEHLKAKIVSCPSGIDQNWTQEVIDLYGPQKINKQPEDAK